MVVEVEFVRQVIGVECAMGRRDRRMVVVVERSWWRLIFCWGDGVSKDVM